MQLLWLPAWYPNKLQPLTGDFIQRHAKATALYEQVQVIYIVRDKNGIITKKIKEENYQADQLDEKIIYYHSPVFRAGIIDKFISNLYYRTLYRKSIKEFIQKKNMPALTHVHVANKNGMVASWVKRKYKIPYVITEHWTVFLPEASPGFNSLGKPFKLMWNSIMNGAKGLTTVSNYLGKAIEQLNKKNTFTVIPNVVDDKIFFPVETDDQKIFNFIHISSLNFAKNPEAILQAFAIVKNTSNHFTLSVFGPSAKAFEKLSEDLGLQNHVIFYSEVPQAELAVFMQKSHALILYSRFETFGCVIIEANACGIPVIVSDIPVFHETVTEGENGYFVEDNNAGLLAQKIIWFMQHSIEMQDKKKIAATTEKYQYSTVGKLFSELYKTALNS